MKKPVIIFIPGFKGSFLRENHNGRLVWPSVWQIYLGNKSLQLPIGAEQTGCLTLDSTKVLDKISLIPGLVEIKFYQRWLKALQQNFGQTHDIIGLDYDWRQDNIHAITKLAKLVAQLNKDGRRSITLTAHSMGGIIASYYLRYGHQGFADAQENWSGAQQVDRVIFAGVPFRGTASMFRSIQIGMRTEKNRRLLCQSAIASFPSSYQLLPKMDVSFLSKLDSSSLEQNIFDMQNWRANRWGLMQPYQSLEGLSFADQRSAASISTIRNPETKSTAAEIFTQAQLNLASQLMGRTHSPVATEIPRGLEVLNVIGKGYDTPNRIYVEQDQQGCWKILSSQEAKQRPDAPSPHQLYDDGDYNVTVASATLPYSFSAGAAQTIYSNHEHSALYDDRLIQQQVIAFIRS
ncbi:MAG: hypothetical protein JKX83_02680 [Pseudomonadales bacterium]|nr:hypothetical protein [Pseudomonadales bacterium]